MAISKKSPSVRKDAPAAKAAVVAKSASSSLPKATAAANIPPPAKAAKVERPKKPKLVRDSFTIPKSEYLLLDELKQRSAKLATAVKKSELLRAGIKALAAMPDSALLAALKAVPAIKTGRPAKT